MLCLHVTKATSEMASMGFTLKKVTLCFDELLLCYKLALQIAFIIKI